MINGFSVRSLVVLSFCVGTLFLALRDPDFRPLYADLAKIALGGYLAQLLPRPER